MFPRYIPRSRPAPLEAGTFVRWRMPPLHWMPNVGSAHDGIAAFITCANGHVMGMPAYVVFETDDGQHIVLGLDCCGCGWGRGLVELEGFAAAIRELNQAAAQEGLAWDPAETHVYFAPIPEITLWKRVKHVARYSWRIGWDNTLEEFRAVVALSLKATWEERFSSATAELLADRVRESPAWRFYPVAALLFACGFAWQAWLGLKWMGRTLVGK